MIGILFSFLMISTVAGVASAPFFDLSGVELIATFGLFFILSMSFVPQKFLWYTTLLITFFFLGVFRFFQFDTAFEQKNYSDAKVEITGKITEPPVILEKSQEIVLLDEEKKSKVLVVTDPIASYKTGEVIKISGNIEIQKGEYKNYLKTRRINAKIAFPEITRTGERKLSSREYLFLFRQKLESNINKLFSEPSSSFVSGLLLGAKKTLPSDLKSDLQKTGTSHLIALSGFNLVIIVQALRIIFSNKSSRLSFVLPLLFIFLFIVMTGAEPSVVRAGLMAFMLLAAERLGRQSSAFIAIVLTGSAMVLLNPYVLNNVGFQLSFAAFAGIIYLAPLVSWVLPGKGRTVNNLLSTILGAQIMALPLIIYHFGTASLISPLVNLLVLPLIPPAMLFAGLAVASSLLLAPLGEIFAIFARPLLELVLAIIHYFSKEGIQPVEIKISYITALFYYIIMGEIIYILNSLKRRRNATKL